MEFIIENSKLVDLFSEGMAGVGHSRTADNLTRY